MASFSLWPSDGWCWLSLQLYVTLWHCGGMFEIERQVRWSEVRGCNGFTFHRCTRHQTEFKSYFIVSLHYSNAVTVWGKMLSSAQCSVLGIIWKILETQLPWSVIVSFCHIESLNQSELESAGLDTVSLPSAHLVVVFWFQTDIRVFFQYPRPPRPLAVALALC